MRATPISAVAAELARDELCPACDAKRALQHEESGLEWRCRSCGASGGALEFVAYALRGCALDELSDGERAEVRQWCRERLQPQG